MVYGVVRDTIDKYSTDSMNSMNSMNSITY
jgi:hypothetical protein